MQAPGPIRGIIWQSSLLLRLASVLVPGAQRDRWLQKRRAEVWHWVHFLYETGRLNSATRRELAHHVFAAFPDAFWQRFDRKKVNRLIAEVPPTPRFCLGVIAVVFLTVLIATGFAPTIRSAFSSAPQKTQERVSPPEISLQDHSPQQRSNVLVLDFTHSPERTRVVAQNQERQGVQIYLVFAGLAFFTSLVILGFRTGRSPSAAGAQFRDKLRWWLFFAGKTMLLQATCFLLALDGTRRLFLASTGEVPRYAGAVSSWFLLVSTVLVLTWSLYDQGRRCHICLKRLSLESYVGVPARLLLGWWGTELVCSEGHGMLHVPEMRASWLEEQHWIQLDDSWKPLFNTEEANVS